MDIYFINICLDWVYKLYEDYLHGLKCRLDKNKHNRINILYIPLNDTSLADYFKIYSIIQNKKKEYKLILCGEINTICEILEKKEVDDPFLYFLNIEQMSNPSYYTYFRKIPTSIKIIDYSEENIPYFENIYPHIFLLPPHFKTIKNEKTIDMLSLKNNEYRSNILDQIILKNKDKLYNIHCFSNVFGNERDILYSQSKIYLNLHCSESHKTMELIRIVNLLSKRVIVLTQNSIHKDLVFIKDSFITFENTEDINELIKEILDNYDMYYNKLFSNENLKLYNDYINTKYNLFMNGNT